MATENVKKTTLRLVVGPCDAEPLLTCVKGVTELGFDSMTVYLTAPETEVYDALKPYASILEKGASLDAKDCNREDIPKVAFVDSLASAVTRDGKPDVCLIFSEKSTEFAPIQDAVASAVAVYSEADKTAPFNCTIVVGPASGITDFDIDVVKSVCSNVGVGSFSNIVASVDIAAVAGCAIASYEINAAFEKANA